jgi:hypothetical protein
MRKKKPDGEWIVEKRELSSNKWCQQIFSVFQLLYERCKEWWRRGRRE